MISLIFLFSSSSIRFLRFLSLAFQSCKIIIHSIVNIIIINYSSTTTATITGVGRSAFGIEQSFNFALFALHIIRIDIIIIIMHFFIPSAKPNHYLYRSSTIHRHCIMRHHHHHRRRRRINPPLLCIILVGNNIAGSLHHHRRRSSIILPFSFCLFS